MLFRIHFLLYCIFVSYNQFLFFSCILYYVACAFVILCLRKYLLTYLLDSKLSVLTHDVDDDDDDESAMILSAFENRLKTGLG